MIQAERVWLDGQLVPFADAQAHVSSFTLHYGLAVFEGIRCYPRADGRSAVFRLGDHIQRLIDSAKIATLEVPYTRAQLETACLDTLRANGLKEAYIRPLVFVGHGALGLGTRDNPVRAAVIAFPWAPPLGEKSAQTGVRTVISSYVRGHLNSALSKAKISGQYVVSVLAKREAQRLGYDEAIMLDTDGRVAEGTADNIFIVRNGTLMTPPLESPILAGITRDSALELARSARIPVVERAFLREDLYVADEVFLTGTAVEVTPVREVDGRLVGDGQPGPITRRIQAAFQAAVRGPGEPHPTWLSYL